MTRVALTDGGGWFDADKAEKVNEGSTHDGRNMISLATGSQWEHEALYRTRGGKWILNHWSNYQGSRESYTLISDADAAAWLVRNGQEPHAACASEYAALEIQ